MDSVHWANFCDRECLSHFRRDGLDLGDAVEHAWTPRGSLYLRLCDRLRVAPQEDTERLRLRLIRAFEAARTVGGTAR